MNSSLYRVSCLNILTMANFNLQPNVTEGRLMKVGNFGGKTMETDFYWYTILFYNQQSCAMEQILSKTKASP